MAGLKPIVGEIKAQVLNDNFSYINQKAEEAGVDPEFEQKVDDLEIDLNVHKAENATQSELGHVKLPESWKIPATMLNGWQRGTSGREPKYFKDDFENVYLCGMVTSGTTTSGTNIFTLPAGYRPSTTRTFVVRTATNDVFGVINITANGNVSITVANDSGTNLDGIIFRAEG